jgi:hypothetical protein
MTEKLRSALHEAADHSRPVQIPDTLWADARRARRRDQVLATVLALVLFVGVGAGVSWLIQPRPEAVPSDGGGSGAGIPSHLYAASPMQWAGVEYQGLPGLSTRRDVGKAAALLPITDPQHSYPGQVVLVRAADGAYVRTTLPGAAATFDHASMPRLSPNGKYVAWPLAKQGPHNYPGIRTMDLTTGMISDRELGSRWKSFSDIVWSPSGRWFGFRVAGPQGAGTGAFDLKVGTWPVGTRLGDTAGSLAVDDVGTQWAVDVNKLHSWAVGAPANEVKLPNGYSAGDGIVAGADGIALGGTDAVTVGEGPRESFVPIPLDGRGHVVPLGWLDHDHLLVSSTVEVGKRPGELGVVTLPDATYEKVGELDSPTPNLVSFATALATPDRPTVARAEPQWVEHDGWAWGRTILVFLVLSVFAFGIGGLGRRASARRQWGHHTGAAMAEASVRGTSTGTYLGL